MQPTREQIDAYRRDGFLVVERFLADDEVERAPRALRRLLRATSGRRACAPTRSTTTPRARRRTSRASSATCGSPTARSPPRSWPQRIAAFARRARRRRRPAPAAGQLHLEAAVGQGAALPPGRRLPRPPRPAEHDDVLDGARRHARRHAARSSTSRARTAGRARRSAAVPRARRLARARPGVDARRAPSSSSCRSRCRPAARRSTTAGRSTAARRTSAPTPSGGR